MRQSRPASDRNPDRGGDCIEGGNRIKRISTGILVATLAAAALLAPTADAATRTKVSLSYADSDFSGSLKSAENACERSRKVKVLQSLPGPDEAAGSDKSDRRGRYSVPGPDAAGAFYAKVASAGACRGASSKKLTTGIARVEIAPAGMLLTGDGDTQQLTATALDASDEPIPGLPAPSWSSDEAATVSVTSGGLAIAEASSGSVQITATIAGADSNPILATIAAPAPGALLITDSQVIGSPELTDPEGEPSFESTFDVILTGVAAPAIGTLIINTESKPIVGRVVAVEDLGNGQIKVTLHQVSLEEAFPDMEIDETLDLSGAAAEINPEIASNYHVTRSGDTFTFTPNESAKRSYRRAAKAGTHALPPFSECEVDTTPSSDSLPVQLEAPPLFTVSFDPSLEILYTADGDLEKLAVDLEPTVSIEGGIKVAAAFEGKIECKVELGVLRAPLGNPLISGLVPFGAGIEAGGKMTVADAGIGTKVEAGGTAEAGLVCPPSDPEDDCSFTGTVDATADIEPELDAPSIGDVRFEPSLEAFGYAELSVGNPFLASIRFDAVKAKAGAKLEGSFATKTSQIAADDYKSSYKASLEASATLGTELEGVAGLLGLGEITGLAVEVSTDLANSPAGVLSADKKTWLSGEEVTFTAHLSQVNFFPSLGPYNVDEVLLIRNSAGNVTEQGAHTPASGDDEVTFNYTAPDSGNSDEFYLFVVTELVPFDLFSLELAQAKTECSDGIDNDGDTNTDFPADPSCTSADDGTEDEAECDDGVDNDADGETDYPSDTGCESAADDTEAPNPQCSDDSDNDGDGDTDYPSDPGCTDLRDDSESGGRVALTARYSSVFAHNTLAGACFDADFNEDPAGFDEHLGLGSWDGAATCQKQPPATGVATTASQTSDVDSAEDGQDWLTNDSETTRNQSHSTAVSRLDVDFTVTGSVQLSCVVDTTGGEPTSLAEGFLDDPEAEFIYSTRMGGASDSATLAPGDYTLSTVTGEQDFLGDTEADFTSAMSCDFDAPVSIGAGR